MEIALKNKRLNDFERELTPNEFIIVTALKNNISKKIIKSQYSFSEGAYRVNLSNIYKKADKYAYLGEENRQKIVYLKLFLDRLARECITN